MSGFRSKTRGVVAPKEVKKNKFSRFKTLVAGLMIAGSIMGGCASSSTGAIDTIPERDPAVEMSERLERADQYYDEAHRYARIKQREEKLAEQDREEAKKLCEEGKMEMDQEYLKHDCDNNPNDSTCQLIFNQGIPTYEKTCGRRWVPPKRNSRSPRRVADRIR